MPPGVEIRAGILAGRVAFAISSRRMRRPTRAMDERRWDYTGNRSVEDMRGGAEFVRNSADLPRWAVPLAREIADSAASA